MCAQRIDQASQRDRLPCSLLRAPSQACQVIENMLWTLKLQSHKLVLASEPFQPAQLMSECTTLVRHLLNPAKDVQLQSLCESGLPSLIGSPFHLKTVLVLSFGFFFTAFSRCRFTILSTHTVRVVVLVYPR